VCPHFSECPSCHFLHTSYEKELQFKREALEKIFFKLPLPNLKVIGAPVRLGYRNRIQLHYDTKNKVLGYFDQKNAKILPVPHCLMGVGPVGEKLREFYHEDHWLKLVPKNSPKGHVEIYLFSHELKVSWNRPYAEGGFSQVFSGMNARLKDELKTWMDKFEPSDLLDLFGGNGNLSQDLSVKKRLCVDLYSQDLGKNFFSQELYADNALVRVKKALSEQGNHCESLILDPPRSGFKELGLWLQEFKPKRIAYVSCDAHTMARDLIPVKDYDIVAAFLVDFFPSTFHFETMLFLERKE
jgi:23S rRNA (uracil1939-C5)-methyltransferase